MPEEITQDFRDKFWAKVDIRKKKECWPWMKSRDSYNYGQSRIFGKSTAAHRVAWILTNGPIGSSKILACHTCDRPEFCNPRHVFLGTNKDNTQDMIKKGRHRGNPKGGRLLAVSGEKNGNAAFTDAQAIEIRSLFSKGFTRKQIREMFKGTRGSVNYIIRGQTYRHLLPSASEGK